jgi:heat shock protein HtpX
MNAFKTGILMAAIFGLLLLIGQYLGGATGLVVALIFALLLNGFAYWFSDKMVLAMYHAQEVSPEQAPRLYAIVERLTRHAQLPMPKVYVINEESPNAFATGRNPEHAAVAVTAGILRILTEEELAGVLAHELAHVRNRDILTATIVATIAGAITFLAHFALIFGGGRDERRGNPIALIVLALLAPLAATLIQLMISRTREYAADQGGADIAENPLALANALRKLDRASRHIPLEDAGPATAHMFIVKPFSGQGVMSLFSTHPPIEDRIARLEAMAERHGIR